MEMEVGNVSKKKEIMAIGNTNRLPPSIIIVMSLLMSMTASTVFPSRARWKMFHCWLLPVPLKVPKVLPHRRP
jgi:hypothetical protein